MRRSTDPRSPRRTAALAALRIVLGAAVLAWFAHTGFGWPFSAR